MADAITSETILAHNPVTRSSNWVGQVGLYRVCQLEDMYPDWSSAESDTDSMSRPLDVTMEVRYLPCARVSRCDWKQVLSKY